MDGVAAFIEICEEDAWLMDQLLAEVERLEMPFGIHLDRCSEGTKKRMKKHRLCVASFEQNDPKKEYTEQHKQVIFDKLSALKKYNWLVQWNADEIWEKDAPAKFPEYLARPEEYLYVRWINCWGDLQHIRVDSVFGGAVRVKFYNVSGRRRWTFDHPITHGCKLLDRSGKAKAVEEVSSWKGELVCLHTGLMTREAREFRRSRWDRIYTKAVGNNPYGFWEYGLMEEEYPPTIVPNPYL